MMRRKKLAPLRPGLKNKLNGKWKFKDIFTDLSKLVG